MASVFRNPTPEEKKEFVNILNQKQDILEKFISKVNDKEREYFLQFKPFCSRCAKFDFKDEIERKMTEMERVQYSTDLSNFELSMPDLEVYGKEDRFKFLKESNAMEPTGVIKFNQIERKVKIGVHKDYRCKVRGCGISIFIPDSRENPNKK